MKYLIRRLADSLLLLAALSVVSFVFAQLAPGDYFSELGTDPRFSTETVAALRAQAGLDRPLPVRYAKWVRSCIRGDLGYSLAYNSPVAPLLWQRIPATLLLTATATFLAWLLAVPIGIWNATVRGTWGDRVSQLIWAVLLTIPELVLAIVLLVLAAESGWFPAGGMRSAGFSAMDRWAQARDLAWHLALPAAVLVLGMLPVLVRQVRASMLDAIDSPFALSARAHGIPRGRLLFRHLLPAAMNPLVSLLGFSLGTLLSASLLVEVVMGWPGLGPLFLEAVAARDFALVLAVVMFSATFLVAANLAADLLLYRLDPRIRTE
ncbi:MAG TPA: ABC transporter permease [Bryobacteraceae bacterium]|nr:ABC transporter permease [Bryobacteraceae bacterium]